MDTQMNPNEYRAAKTRSCIKVADTWCAAIRITVDQDKSYSSGRTVIPEQVATTIRALVNRLSTLGQILADNIRLTLPDCSVDFNQNTGAINIIFPSKKGLQIECEGVDGLNLAPVYVAARSTKSEAIFIYFEQNSPSKPHYIQGDTWFLWRGNFPENQNLSRLRNYFNKIDEPLLTLAFRDFA